MLSRYPSVPALASLAPTCAENASATVAIDEFLALIQPLDVVNRPAKPGSLYVELRI